jgi:hypothetical protein
LAGRSFASRTEEMKEIGKYPYDILRKTAKLKMMGIKLV